MKDGEERRMSERDELTREGGAMSEIPSLMLYSDGLLSKWGFGDGDIVGDYVFDHLPDLAEDIVEVDESLVLIALVKSFVIPVLDQKVEYFTFSALHNPIRAKSIDGMTYSNHFEYDRGTSGHHTLLTPATIDIPPDQVAKAIADVKEKYGSMSMWDLPEYKE